MAVVSDPVSDFLTRLKNATRADKEDFVAPYSKVKEEIARILKEEGYIWSYEKVVEEGSSHPLLKAKPRYTDGVPALTDVKRVSRPGLRKYVGAGEIPKVLGGLGISIVSTSQGVMAGHRARRMNVGGELLAYVW
ncbi:MAG: 30S ribosomal protein S8 [Verrucomicrobiota bacterium]